METMSVRPYVCDRISDQTVCWIFRKFRVRIWVWWKSG